MADGRAWIRELRPGDDLDETYAVRSKELRRRRGGGAFLALSLADRTGQVAALAWENVEALERTCQVGAVVQVRGQVQRYNGRLQVVVRSAAALDPEAVDQDLFVRASAVDPDILWQRLNGWIERIEEPNLKQLMFRILADPEVANPLREAAAARSMHHAYRSGLLEHTVSMAAAAAPLAVHYGLDVSLVLTGVLLHDLGKIWELEAAPTIEYTDDGRLLGHLPMTVLYVERRLAELPSFPPELRLHLLHILLAHHGEYAYGSPRRPKTPEALLVHMVDTLDSKMAGMLEIMSNGGETEEAWTPYSPILERHVYRRRPPPAGEEPE